MFKLKLRVCGEGFITDLNSNTFYGAFATAAINKHGVDSEIAVKALTETTFSCALTDDLEVMKFNVFEVNKAMIGRSSETNNEVSTIKYWSTPFKKSNVAEREQNRDREDIIVLCETSINKDDFKKVVELMLLNGLGKRRTHGFGQFKLISLEETSMSDINMTEKPESIKILGNMIPVNMQMVNGDYKVKSIQGRCNDGSVREKIAVIMPGSTIGIRNLSINSDGTVGQLLKCQNESGETYYINGKAIVKAA